MNTTEKSSRSSGEDIYYGPHWYGADPKVLVELKTLKPHKPVLAAMAAWFWIFVLVKGFLALASLSTTWLLLFPVVIFLIAGRAGVFLQLAHEAAHGLISPGKFNNWFGNWVTCYPIGLDLKGYQDPHLRHHACTNQICDPISDSEKYRKVCDIRKPKLWLYFLKDILGITAISIRFLYEQPLANKYEKEIEDYLETEEGYTSYHVAVGTPLQSLKKLASIALMQTLILSLLFNLNVVHYIALWLVPLVTAHMFLMRVRGIAEHGLGMQLGVTNLEEKTRGIFFTRSFGTSENHYRFRFLNWIEQWLIGSLNVYYHHEHHLYPKIPYYNLPKIHQIIHSKMRENNPLIFAKGYFDCLFFNLRPNQGIPHPRPDFP